MTEEQLAEWNSWDAATKAFISQEAEYDLYLKICEILGQKKEDFTQEYVSVCEDVSCDPYDSSIEVIRPQWCKQMTRAQADEILSLGFGQIYETFGDEACLWNKFGCGSASRREPQGLDRLKRENLELKKKMKDLEKSLD